MNIAKLTGCLALIWCQAFLFSVLAQAQEQKPEYRAYKAPLYTKEWHEASRYPDRISLTLSGDPATSFSVSWRTDTTVTTAFAEIALATPAPRFWRNAETMDASTSTMDASNIANAQIISNFHTVTFTGLQPNTLYAYRVGDGEVWSEWIQYRTAKAGAEPFSFLYVGDTQNQIMELWSRLIREGYRNQPDASFIIHAGDLVNRAHKDSEWHEWFEAGGWIHRMLPALPVPGNHEYNEYNPDEDEEYLSKHWNFQFELPKNGPEGLEETAYYVDYQGARIVGLNSNVMRAEQAEWLDKVLTENEQKWTILTFHHPIFSASAGRNNEQLRNLWKPVIDKHQVDIVLQGHDHSYARGNTPPPAAENEMSGVNTKDQTGTVYVVSVSGGKMYSLRPDAWKDFEAKRMSAAENTQLFQQIDISGDTLTYYSYTATREVYDAFYLIKNEDGPNRMVEITDHRIPERRFSNTISYDNPLAVTFETEKDEEFLLDESEGSVSLTHDQARGGEHAASLTAGARGPAYLTDDYEARYNNTTWYGFSVFMPEELASGKYTFAKWWYGEADNDYEINERPAPIQLQLDKGSLKIEAYSDANYNSKPETVQASAVNTRGNARFKSNAWNDLVIEAVMMYDNRGKFNVWLNGEMVVEYTGPIGFNDDDGHILKMGLEALQSISSEKTIYIDEYRRGHSFDFVNPAKFD